MLFNGARPNGSLTLACRPWATTTRWRQASPILLLCQREATGRWVNWRPRWVPRRMLLIATGRIRDHSPASRMGCVGTNHKPRMYQAAAVVPAARSLLAVKWLQQRLLRSGRPRRTESPSQRGNQACPCTNKASCLYAAAAPAPSYCQTQPVRHAPRGAREDVSRTQTIIAWGCGDGHALGAQHSEAPAGKHGWRAVVHHRIWPVCHGGTCDNLWHG